MESVLLDAAGHRRSPATMPGCHRGRPPGNKGEQYPADPPTVEEIISAMRKIGDGADGHRLRALIVLLWRAGLRISQAPTLRSAGARPVAVASDSAPLVTPGIYGLARGKCRLRARAVAPRLGPRTAACTRPWISE